MKAKLVYALVAAVLGATVYCGVVFATPSSGLTTTILAKSTFDDLHLRGQALTKIAGSNGWSHQKRVWLALLKTRGMSDIYVVDNKIAAGGTTGWHSHAGPSLIFVVAGSITNYISDDPVVHAADLHRRTGLRGPGRQRRAHPAQREHDGRGDDRCPVPPAGRRQEDRCHAGPRQLPVLTGSNDSRPARDAS